MMLSIFVRLPCFAVALREKRSRLNVETSGWEERFSFLLRSELLDPLLDVNDLIYLGFEAGEA